MWHRIYTQLEVYVTPLLFHPLVHPHIFWNSGSDDTDVDEATSNTTLKNSKPWGASGQFCPVALRDGNVLWPGNNELLLR